MDSDGAATWKVNGLSLKFKYAILTVSIFLATGWSSDVEQQRDGAAAGRSSSETEQPGHLEKADSGGRAPSSKVSNVRRESHSSVSLLVFSQFVLRTIKDTKQELFSGCGE
jgi:hypothetical protein